MKLDSTLIIVLPTNHSAVSFVNCRSGDVIWPHLDRRGAGFKSPGAVNNAQFWYDCYHRLGLSILWLFTIILMLCPFHALQLLFLCACVRITLSSCWYLHQTWLSQSPSHAALWNWHTTVEIFCLVCPSLADCRLTISSSPKTMFASFQNPFPITQRPRLAGNRKLHWSVLWNQPITIPGKKCTHRH